MQQATQQPSRWQQFLNGGGDFLLIILSGMLVCLMFALLTSCKQTEYITVPEVHTEYHHTTDSVRQVDSIIDHQTTIIREVDSATMAQYGIRLENAQRAWIVQSDRLMREIQQLRATKTDTLVVRDSIPLPYPVKEYVKERYVPGAVKLLAWIGGILLALALGYGGWKLYRLLHPLI